MEVVPQVHQIKCGGVNVYLIVEDAGLTLVDAGYAASSDAILLYVRDLGRQPADIKRLVLTHRHPDHIGGASALKRATGATVLAHLLDTPAISADPKLSFPAPPLGTIMRLVGGAKLTPPPCAVDDELRDGMTLPVLGGLQVIWTPGHTHGHCSLYHPERRWLIAGDAVMTMGGKVRQTFPFLCDDYEEACRTVRNKLAPLPISWVLAGHGDPREANVAANFAGLARQYGAM